MTAHADPLEVACPQCGALPGQPCRGITSPARIAHVRRHVAADKQRAQL